MDISPQKIDFNIKRAYTLVLKCIFFLYCIEIAFYPSYEICFAIFISFLGILLCKSFIFKTYNLLFYPVSTIAILFYVIFFLILPIPATLLELKPVSYNLHSTINTYINLLILEIILIITHSLYISFTNKKNFIRNFFLKVHFFDKFSSQEIWLLILSSSAFYICNIFFNGLYNENSENSTSSLPTGLYILNLLISGYYQILFIFFFKKFNLIKSPYLINKPLIIILSILLFLTGIATNMRTAAISIFANAFFTLIVYAIYNPINYSKVLKPKALVLITLTILFFFGPFMKVSEAMVSTRGERNGMNGLEMLTKTFNSIDNKSDKKFNNSQLQAQLENKQLIWDEEYLSNDVLNRFCSLKILDETLFHAQRIGYGNKYMQDELKLKILDCLPGTVKDWLNIKISDEIRQHSLTDKLYSLSINYAYGSIGGVKIGTLQGLGLAIFGYWYMIIIIPIFIIIFFLLDATVYYKNSILTFSLWFFVNIMMCCYYFSDRHYYLFEFRFIMRTYVESIFFYLITINIVKRLPIIKH